MIDKGSKLHALSHFFYNYPLPQTTLPRPCFQPDHTQIDTSILAFMFDLMG
jgi:hypothetical protein